MSEFRLDGDGIFFTDVESPTLQDFREFSIQAYDPQGWEPWLVIDAAGNVSIRDDAGEMVERGVVEALSKDDLVYIVRRMLRSGRP